MADSLGRFNPFRYRSYFYDEETGLHYCYSRYYSPEMGRFINSDAIAVLDNLKGFNAYVYCMNDPISKIDGSGYVPGDRFKKMDETAIDAGKYIYDNVTTDIECATKIYSGTDDKGDKYYSYLPLRTSDKPHETSLQWIHAVANDF